VISEFKCKTIEATVLYIMLTIVQHSRGFIKA